MQSLYAKQIDEIHINEGMSNTGGESDHLCSFGVQCKLEDVATELCLTCMKCWFHHGCQKKYDADVFDCGYERFDGVSKVCRECLVSKMGEKISSVLIWCSRRLLF